MECNDDASGSGEVIISERIHFEGPNEVRMTGILEHQPESSTSLFPGKDKRCPLVLFIHGLYQHKNVAFLRDFGKRIPKDAVLRAKYGRAVSTFRFDCRGLGQSDGKTSFAPHAQNTADTLRVVQFLEERGFRIVCLFGYSAGGNVALLSCSKLKHIRHVVNASGRFLMKGIRNTLSRSEIDCIEKGGAFEISFSRRGKNNIVVVDREELRRFESIDNKEVCASIPSETRVLLTHGLADARVPVEDSYLFSRGIANSTHLLLDCGHNYKPPASREKLYASWRKWLIDSPEACAL